METLFSVGNLHTTYVDTHFLCFETFIVLSASCTLAVIRFFLFSLKNSWYKRHGTDFMVYRLLSILVFVFLKNYFSFSFLVLILDFWTLQLPHIGEAEAKAISNATMAGKTPVKTIAQFIKLPREERKVRVSRARVCYAPQCAVSWLRSVVCFVFVSCVWWCHGV